MSSSSYSLAGFNVSGVSKFLPLGDKYPPALTIGLIIFLPLLYILNIFLSINSAIALSPSSLTNFNLNQLSLYPLGHLSIFHLIFNLLAIVAPLSQFERYHGTVYTGVILNLFAVSTAVLYAVLGLVFYPSASVLGSSAWVFSFAGFFAYKESLIKPIFTITPTVTIPTLYTPMIPLIIIAVIFPGSSFIGHFFGLISGYLLAFGYLNKLVPSSSIIEKIEEKLDKLINLIPTPFKYYKEVDAKYLRTQDDYVSILPTYTPSTNTEASVIPQQPSGFQGQGHVLGA